MKRIPLVITTALLAIGCAIAFGMAAAAHDKGNVFISGSVEAAEKAAQMPTTFGYILAGAAVLAAILAVAAKP